MYLPVTSHYCQAQSHGVGLVHFPVGVMNEFHTLHPVVDYTLPHSKLSIKHVPFPLPFQSMSCVLIARTICQ